MLAFFNAGMVILQDPQIVSHCCNFLFCLSSATLPDIGSNTCEGSLAIRRQLVELLTVSGDDRLGKPLTEPHICA